MPRPKLLRRVCFLPEFNSFAAQELKTESLETITMTVEEFESIRLIDLDNYDQEEAAIALDVSRGTLQRIYNEAKKKVAEMLICGKRLIIQEGSYRLCNHPEHEHHRRCGSDTSCCGQKK